MDARLAPGIYTEHVTATFSDGSGTAPVDVTFQVLCSLSNNTCPKLQILEGSTVISSPNPKPTAVVGERQTLAMRQQQGTGLTGPYTLSSPSWSPPPQAIKGYPLPSTAPTNAPTPMPLSASDEQAVTLLFYLDDPTKTTGVTAAATLTSTHETAIVSATASFELLAPPMSWTSTSNPVVVGLYPFPEPTGTPDVEEALSLGKPVNLSTAGIVWNILAPTTPTPLPGVSGEMNVIQTITTTQAGVPAGCQSAHSTSGTELDTQLWYNAPVGIGATWSSDDSPATQLLTPSTCTSFSRQDTFVDYLMFQSSKANSIWTPIMQLTWGWSGTAGYTNGQWSRTTGAGPGSPSGSTNFVFPVWTGIDIPTN